MKMYDIDLCSFIVNFESLPTAEEAAKKIIETDWFLEGKQKQLAIEVLASFISNISENE